MKANWGQGNKWGSVEMERFDQKGKTQMALLISS